MALRDFSKDARSSDKTKWLSASALAVVLMVAWPSFAQDGTSAPTAPMNPLPTPPGCSDAVQQVINQNRHNALQARLNANHKPNPPNNLTKLACLDSLLNSLFSATPTLPGWNQILQAIENKACQMAMAEWTMVENEAISSAESAVLGPATNGTILGSVNGELASLGVTQVGVSVGNGAGGLNTTNAGNAADSYSPDNISGSVGGSATAAGNSLSNAATSAGNSFNNATSSVTNLFGSPSAPSTPAAPAAPSNNGGSN